MISILLYTIRSEPMFSIECSSQRLYKIDLINNESNKYYSDAVMSLLSIPSDVFYLIIPLLPPKSICSLARTCRLFSQRLSNDSLIWTALYRENLSKTIPPPKTVKERYLSHIRALSSLMYCDGDMELSATHGHEAWLENHRNRMNILIQSVIGHMVTSAIRNNQSECLRLILPCYDFRRCQYTISHLRDAIDTGNAKILEALLEAGLSVEDGAYPELLKLATKRNHMDVVTLLLTKGEGVRCRPWEIVKTGVKHNSFASIHAFHTYNNKWGDLFLEEAIRQNSYTVAKFLIEDEYTLRLNVDDNFEFACEHGTYDIMLSLYYRRRPNINSNGGRPLVMSAKGGHPIIVKFLLEQGADPTVLPEAYRLLYNV